MEYHGIYLIFMLYFDQAGHNKSSLHLKTINLKDEQEEKWTLILYLTMLSTELKKI